MLVYGCHIKALFGDFKNDVDRHWVLELPSGIMRGCLDDAVAHEMRVLFIARSVFFPPLGYNMAELRRWV